MAEASDTQTTARMMESRSSSDDYFERQRLEKDNFDLKMKVYYLEESLRKVSTASVASPEYDTVTLSENSLCKMQLDERTAELDRRNVLLMKAKTAIDSLKTELQRLKAEEKTSSNFEERLEILRQSNDDIEVKYRTQFVEIDAELAATRESVETLQREKERTEEALADMTYSVRKLESDNAAFEEEKKLLEIRMQGCRDLASEKEKELSATFAKLEFCHVQLGDQEEQLEILESKLAEGERARKAQEESLNALVENIRTQTESQVKAVKALHESELAACREEAAKVKELADREHQKEISQMKRDFEEKEEMWEYNSSKSKAHESHELAELKRAYREEVEEKDKEIRAMRSILDSDRKHIDTLTTELEDSRVELRKRKMDEIGKDTKVFDFNSLPTGMVLVSGEELKVLRKNQDALGEVREALRTTEVEKTQLAVKLEAAREGLDTTKESLKKQVSKLLQ
jgi:DNA repair exonuclease SbcCD ATPase subunit